MSTALKKLQSSRSREYGNVKQVVVNGGSRRMRRLIDLDATREAIVHEICEKQCDVKAGCKDCPVSITVDVMFKQPVTLEGPPKYGPRMR